MKIIDMGDLDWERFSAELPNTFRAFVRDRATGQCGLCEGYETVQSSIAGMSDKCIRYSYNNTHFIAKNLACETPEDFKEAVKGLKVIYKTA